MTEASQQNVQQQTPTSGGNGGSAPASSQQSGNGAAPAAGSEHVRPEHVPEALWDSASGFKIDDAVRQLTELQAFKAGEDSRKAAVPATADAYKLALSKEFKAPEGVTFDLDESDPMFAFGRQVAHAMGADQAGFENLVGMYATMRAKEAKEIDGLVAKQMEVLGPKAQERVDAIKTFLSAKLGPDAPIIFGGQLQLAKGVEHLERLMRLTTSGGVPGYSQSGRAAAAAESVQDRWYPTMANLKK